MTLNPYTPPADVKAAPTHQQISKWSLQRWAFVLLLSPLAIVVWVATAMGIALTMRAFDWPPLEIRRRVGVEVALLGIALISALPALLSLLILIRLSRGLGEIREMPRSTNDSVDAID